MANVFSAAEIIDMGIAKEKKRRDFYGYAADKFKEKDVISVAVYFIMFTYTLSKLFVKYLKTGKTFPELDKILKKQSEIWRKEYSTNPPL